MKARRLNPKTEATGQREGSIQLDPILSVEDEQAFARL